MKDAAPPDGTLTAANVRITSKEDGTIEYAGDPAAVAEVLEAAERGRALRERRRATWGEIGGRAMTRLAKSFPSLRGAPGVDPWNVDHFLRWSASGVISHGEVLAAKFVLSVWNPGTDWEDVARRRGLLSNGRRFRRFDLFEAMNVWDEEHMDAALTWIELPFFP